MGAGSTPCVCPLGSLPLGGCLRLRFRGLEFVGPSSLGLPLSWGGDSPLRGLYLKCPSPAPLSLSQSISERVRSLFSFLPAKSNFIKRGFVERRFDNWAVALLEHLSSWSMWKWQSQSKMFSFGPRLQVKAGQPYNLSLNRDTFVWNKY